MPDDAAHKLKQVLPRLDSPRRPSALQQRQEVRLPRPPDHAARGTGDQRSGHSGRRFPADRAAAISAGPHRRPGARRRRRGPKRRGRRGEILRRPAAHQTRTAAPVDRRAGAGGGARGTAHRDGEFQAIGGCGIVMDVRTGEVLAMVSLPDYDANVVRTAPATTASIARSTGRTSRAARSSCRPPRWRWTAASCISGTSSTRRATSDRPLHDHRFRGQAPLALSAGGAGLLLQPRRRAYRPGRRRRAAARLAQEAWACSTASGIELPEAARPIIQPAANWKEIATMTVGFGHGIAVTPLHVVRGTAAVANGGTPGAPDHPGAAIPARAGGRRAGDAARPRRTSCAS